LHQRATTGTLPAGIVGLRLGDIDWPGATIKIVPQKTGSALTLPLPAMLVGKLADYPLVSGRARPTITCYFGPWHHTPGSPITPPCTG